MRVEEGFQPTPYVEGNPYTTDTVLPSLLKRLLPREVFAEVDRELEYFGVEVLTTLRTISKTVAEPKLVQYDHWGKRIDDLQTSEGWRRLKAKMQQEGAVGIFYERQYKEYSRLFGFSKTFLATGDTHVIFCPLSMTDGASRVIETVGSPALKNELLPRLISRDPDYAFTAGQWMTERPGGSDVSQTETVATPVPNASSPYGPVYSIDGFKWFSSATDSDVALALARTGASNAGTRGLSLFLIPLRRPFFPPQGTSNKEGRPSALTNNIKVHRLKNKVGTKIVPTAELELAGAEAYLLGAPGQGVKLIAPVLNITRLHSAIGSVGALRRCLAAATAYSSVRTIAGGRQLLKDNALHVAELARVGVVYRALTHMVFNAVALMGKVECGVATDEEEMRLRMLTPACKAFAAEKAVWGMEESMAAMGGQGYMEETMFGTNIRDGLVEKIWEGTITVLSLDLVRAASKPGVVNSWSNWANKVLASCPITISSQLGSTLSVLQAAMANTTAAYQTNMPPLLPRPALMLFSHATCALFLLEHAVWSHATGEASASTDVEVFRRWVDEGSFKAAVDEFARVAGDTLQEVRAAKDSAIVYGASERSAPARASGDRARL